MKKPDTTLIDQDWPVDELEEVHSCPYCGSTDRAVAYKNVQDWSFYCAPGKWTYWDCLSCEALYLNPRPKEANIGKAYASYYTHNSNANSFLKQLKISIKNELFYHSVNVQLSPRFHIPKWLGFITKPLQTFIHIPFELQYLRNQPKGKLLDVGCGSGNNLKIATQLGWEAVGLEIDTNAVKAARSQGHNVVEGDFRKLAQLPKDFDCIVCSHVLEHVHSPLELLALLTEHLNPKGILLLSLPNAVSSVRVQFGDNWRGLEAPRHVAIPTLKKITSHLYDLGYSTIIQTDAFDITILESVRIKERKLYSSKIYAVYFKLKSIFKRNSYKVQTDFIQIAAKKNA